ncbi:hypothetical protein [Sphingobium phenoxybenzoativorans]|uniref:hypothetical protein n=1 Tax=Sphingobium phenoxybenzoativorans TaxID=1592790 RepID=UPI0008722774|nr:hypothetical protein [Sphingobium phenoxybenzoativorans]
MNAFDRLLGRDQNHSTLDQSALSVVYQSLITIDPAATIAKREEFRSSQAAIQDAIASTNARLVEIRQEIIDLERAGDNAAAVAKAMMDGTAPPKSISDLEEERERYLLILKGLKLNAEQAGRELYNVAAPIIGEIGEAFGPLVDELRVDASEAFSLLAQCYVQIAALANCATSHEADALRRALSDIVGTGIEAGFLSRSPLETPKEIVALNDVPALQIIKYPIPPEIAAPSAPTDYSLAAHFRLNR